MKSKIFKSVFASISIIFIALLTSCGDLAETENTVELEFYLPYLSVSGNKSSRVVSSTDTGDACNFVVGFKHEETQEYFELTGKSGETISTGKIRTGVWGITLNAYVEQVLKYSSATKTTLHAGETKTIAFSFSKADLTDDDSSSGIVNKPVNPVTSNIEFTSESEIRADTSILDIDLSKVVTKISSGAVIALYDASSNLIASKTIPDSILAEDAETAIVEMNVSITAGTYSLSIFQGRRRVCVSATITVTAVPSITKIYIPDAGISYAGSDLPVIIDGSNLTSDNFDSEKLILSDNVKLSDSYTVLSATKILCHIKSPSAEGKLTVTATYDELYEVSTDFTVYSEEQCSKYSVGDIILNDGTKIDYSENLSLTDDQKANAVAVVGATMYGGGTVLGAALKLSDLIPFTTSGTSDLSKAGMTSTAEYGYISGDANQLKSIGTTDPFGNDNLDYMTQIDSAAVNDFDEAYPVFAYAENYGITNEFTGDYQSDWYIPSQTELKAIMENHPVLNKTWKMFDNTTLSAMNYVKHLYDSSYPYYYWSFDYIYSSTYSDNDSVFVFYIEDDSDNTDLSDNRINSDIIFANAKHGYGKYRGTDSAGGKVNIYDYRESGTPDNHTYFTGGVGSVSYCYYSQAGTSKYTGIWYIYFYPRAMPVHLISLE